MGSVPLYPTLAPSGSSVVGSNHCVSHPGGDGHPVAWRALPCLLWAGHKALPWHLPSVVVSRRAPHCLCPHLTHHPNPKGLLVSARTPGQNWGSWWQQSGQGTALTKSKLTLPSCRPCNDFLAPSPCKTTPLPGPAELKIEPCLWKVHVG